MFVESCWLLILYINFIRGMRITEAARMGYCFQKKKEYKMTDDEDECG